jgi:hypothetical protein
LIEFGEVDLANDVDVARYLKTEIVAGTFATAAGEILSREGPNLYAIGDALVTASDGSQWSVSRAQFEAKYEPVAAGADGCDGAFRAKPVPVLAKQIPVPFRIALVRSGDVLRASANDWLLQYAPGDFGVVENARFQSVYKRI